MTANTSATGGFLRANPAPPNFIPLQDNDLVDFFQRHIVGMTTIKDTNVRPRWQPSPPPMPDVDVDWAAIGIARRPADSFPAVQHLPTTYGQLLGGTLLEAEQDPAAWTPVTDGSFGIIIDEDEMIPVTNIDFRNCTSMADVAAVVTARMSAQTANAACNWVKDHFEITCLTLAQSVAPLVVLDEGTDIAVRLMCSGDTLRATVNGADGADEVSYSEELDMLCSFYGPNADRNAMFIKAGFAVAQNREPMQRENMNLIEVQEGYAVPSLQNNKWYYRVDQFIRFRRMITLTYPVLNLLSAHGTIESAVMTQTIEA